MGDELTEFLPTYPDGTEDDFSFQIFKRKEFNELTLEANENRPTEQGQLLLDQIFIKRFISGKTPYDKSLLYRGIGTGKTCVASAIVENFKLMSVGGSKRKPALLLVTSPGLAATFRNLVVNVCTEPNTYFAPKGEDEQMTERKIKGRLKSSVNASYEIKTYTTFLTVQDGSKSTKTGRKPVPITEDMIEEYSNRVIILDESHTIRQTKVEEQQMYDTLHLLLHKVKGCRILLMTGTPTQDDADEIASQLNLILPMDKQLPTGSSFSKRYFNKDGSFKNRDEFVEKIRGPYVSYIRPMLSTAEKRIMGTTEPWGTMTRVWPDVMSDFQYSVWKKAKDADKDEEGQAALRSGRDASIAVYPKIDNGVVSQTEGLYGTSAFNTYFREKKGKEFDYKFKDALVKREFRDNLRRYSTKFDAIIRDIKEHPNDLIFVYTGGFVSGAGAVLFALCLELHGLKRARSPKSIANPSTEERRFAVFSSVGWTINKDTDIEAMMEIINRPDNRDGDHCQVVIASQKLKMGYTFKRFTRFHSLTPDWNRPSRDQADGRVFRFGSHDDMPEDRRYVEFYNHVAVKSLKSDEETTDIRVVRLSDIKERKQVEVYRILKEVSYDCQLNYKRNVLESDVDGERECDYRECNYKCEGTPDENIDQTPPVWGYSVDEDDIITETYDAYYSDDEVKRIEGEIVKLFSVSHFNLELNVLVTLVGGDGKVGLVLRALDNVITNRVPIRNRYGFISYLKEDGDIYFLDDNFSIGTPYSDAIYTSQLFVTEKLQFDDVAEIERMRDDEERMSDVCKVIDSTTIRQLSETTRIALFEMLWIDEKNKRLSSAGKKALEAIKTSLQADDYLVEVAGLWYHVFTRNAYSNQDKYAHPLLTRVYRESSEMWEYASQEEEERVIDATKRNKVSKRDKLASRHPFFGETKEERFTIVTTKNGKPIGNGKACSSYSKDELEGFITKLKLTMPDTINKQTLCSALREGMTRKGLMAE